MIDGLIGLIDGLVDGLIVFDCVIIDWSIDWSNTSEQTAITPQPQVMAFEGIPLLNPISRWPRMRLLWFAQILGWPLHCWFGTFLHRNTLGFRPCSHWGLQVPPWGRNLSNRSLRYANHKNVLDTNCVLKPFSNTSWCFQHFNPCVKYWSNWIISPNRGEHAKKHLKSSPRNAIRDFLILKAFEQKLGFIISWLMVEFHHTIPSLKLTVRICQVSPFQKEIRLPTLNPPFSGNYYVSFREGIWHRAVLVFMSFLRSFLISLGATNSPKVFHPKMCETIRS